MRAWSAALAITLSLASSSALAEEDDTLQAYRIEPDGRSYRVSFDPASRLVVGAGYGPRAATEIADEPDRGYVEVAVRYRHRWAFPAEGVAWKLEHEMLPTRVGLGHGVRFETAAYRGRYMRWSRDGQIFFPPDLRVPFPLDVGFETELGHVDYRELDPGVGVDLDVVRSEIVLGFLRNESMKSFVRLGIGPRYGLRLWEPDAATPLEVHHLIAPFSSGSFTAHHESADGHHVVELAARASYALRVDHGWAFSAHTRASYELVILAINDLPASTYVDAAYGYRGDPSPGHGAHEVVGTAGLRMSIPIDGATGAAAPRRSNSPASSR